MGSQLLRIVALRRLLVEYISVVCLDSADGRIPLMRCWFNEQLNFVVILHITPFDDWLVSLWLRTFRLELLGFLLLLAQFMQVLRFPIR